METAGDGEGCGITPLAGRYVDGRRASSACSAASWSPHEKSGLADVPELARPAPRPDAPGMTYPGFVGLAPRRGWPTRERALSISL